MKQNYTAISQKGMEWYGQMTIEPEIMSIILTDIENAYHNNVLYWESKDETKKLISDMDNQHALNCLNLIQRQTKNASETKLMFLDGLKALFTAELTKRGEARKKEQALRQG